MAELKYWMKEIEEPVVDNSLIHLSGRDSALPDDAFIEQYLAWTPPSSSPEPFEPAMITMTRPAREKA
jgi:hypothetical protein